MRGNEQRKRLGKIFVGNALNNTPPRVARIARSQSAPYMFGAFMDALFTIALRARA
jgi:hypothetical protein